MNIRAQAARGLKWQAIEIGGRQVLSLLVFTTLARLLDPSAFGLLGLVGIYFAFVAMFVDQGIGTALIQRKTLAMGHLDAAFWFNIFCACLLCGMSVALAGPVARIFQEPKLQPLLQWASLSLIINATGAVHHTLFLRNMDFRRPAIRTLVGNLIGGLVGVGMALTGWGVWSLIGQQLASALAGAVFLWTASPWRPRFKFSLICLRELMTVSASVFSVSFLWFFSSRLDQIVIGRSLGTDALGQYVVGGKLTQLAKVAVHDPIGTVSMPALSQLQGNDTKMCQAIYKGMELNALVSFAIFVGLASVARDLVPCAFGAKWAVAGGICTLYSLYMLVNALQVFIHPALIASGGPGGYVVLNVFHAIGVGIACLAGTRYGINCLLIGLITNALIISIPAIAFLRRRIGLSMMHYWRPCLVPMIASGLMAMAVLCTRSTMQQLVAPWILLCLEILGGAIVYVGTISLLNRQSLVRINDIAFHALGLGPRRRTVSAIANPTT